MSIGIISGVMAQAVISRNESAGKPEEVSISEAIKKSKSVPTGYKGSEGKVKGENGGIKTTAVIEGNDAGFFVEFDPVKVKGQKSLSLSIKGNIFQRQGWDHYASIQVVDEDGKRFILQELCKEGKYGSCEGKNITKPGDVKNGTSLKIQLPADLKSIQRLEVVFIGDTTVAAGFTIGDIKLVK